MIDYYDGEESHSRTNLQGFVIQQLINSDKLQGVIRNPFAFYFPIQRGFSGSIQTLPLHWIIQVCWP